MEPKFNVRWLDRGGWPRVAPNPAYPCGIDLDISNGVEPNCTVSLPYPAKRLGVYHLDCQRCMVSVTCTTAGRPDDPRSIKIACVMKGSDEHV
jgi:hypothetical protein